MAEAVTRREFARLEGCDEKQVRRALARGLLVADAEGKLNPAQVGSGWRKPRADSKEAPAKAPAAPRAKKSADTAADTAKPAKNVRSTRNVRTMSAGTGPVRARGRGRCRGSSYCDPQKVEMTMATQDPTRLPAAVEMLQNQHLQAREYVLNTLKYPAGNPDFGRAVVDVMLVLATNELTLTQKRSK